MTNAAAFAAARSPRAIRVMHITSVEKPNYYLNNLVDFSARDAVEFSAFTTGSDQGFIAELRERGIDGGAFDSLGRSKMLSAYQQTLDSIRRTDADIIHAHLFESSLVGARAAKKLGKRLIITRHHSDAIHRISNPLKRSIYSRLDKYLSDSADLIIAPSQMVKDTLLKEGASEAKVHFIPYGQRLERFQLDAAKIGETRTALRMGQGIALVCVSRLFHEKGHRFLFDAFARLRNEGHNLRLYLVGTGDHEDALRGQLAGMGIAHRVEFLGWRDDALYVMAAADAVVHPSLQEALPSAVIEACMLQKPLVVTDVSGVRDITAGHASIVPPADANALYGAMKTVLADLPAAQRRAQDARHHITTYMDPQRVADAYLDCYREVMSA